MFGQEGEVTISSEGYIAGNNFKITKEGSAEFNDLKAFANIDVANGAIKNVSTSVVPTGSSGSGTKAFNDNFAPLSGVAFEKLGDATFTDFVVDYAVVSFGSQTNLNGLLLFKKNGTAINQSFGSYVTGGMFITNGITDGLIPIGADIDEIEIYAAYYTANAGTSYGYSFEISSVNSNKVQVKKLIDPVDAQDAVNLQHLEDNYKIVRTTLSPSASTYTVSGGTLSSLQKVELFFGDRKFIRYTGSGTITNDLSEIVITFPTAGALTSPAILANIDRNASTGSGVDTIYVYQTNSYTYRLRHDYANGNSTQNFEVVITGFQVI